MSGIEPNTSLAKQDKSVNTNSIPPERDGHVNIRVSGWITGRHAAQVQLEGQVINRYDLAAWPPCQELAPLKDAKALAITVHTGNDFGSVCDTQDALFAALSHLTTEHALQAIKVDIQVTAMDPGGRRRLDTGPENQDVFAWTAPERRHIEVGSVSRAHLAAFLTDPLRKIRNLRRVMYVEAFSLVFAGRDTKPFKEIPPMIKAMLCSNMAVPN